eukprot:2004370-Rhodomonas_salina.1
MRDSQCFLVSAQYARVAAARERGELEEHTVVTCRVPFHCGAEFHGSLAELVTHIISQDGEDGVSELQAGFLVRVASNPFAALHPLLCQHTVQIIIKAAASREETVQFLGHQEAGIMGKVAPPVLRSQGVEWGWRALREFPSKPPGIGKGG